MGESNLIASVEKRLETLIEINRRNLREHGITKGDRIFPTVTLTREYGCAGFPVAQRLQEIMEKRSGLPWLVMDKELFRAAAENHHVSEEVFSNLGVKHRFLDEALSTFSPRWKSDKDYYRLLVRQIAALAQEGNVILVGRGAAGLTQELGNCFHFRIVAPLSYRIAAISSRHGVDAEEAERMAIKHQRQREAFIADFLGRDLADPTLYHLVFNNARVTVDRMAQIIADFVTGKQ